MRTHSEFLPVRCNFQTSTQDTAKSRGVCCAQLCSIQCRQMEMSAYILAEAVTLVSQVCWCQCAETLNDRLQLELDKMPDSNEFCPNTSEM